MDWAQVTFLFVGQLGVYLPLLIWFRAESRNDWRHMDAKIEANLRAIHDEMKDFHGRLCNLEERRK